MKKNIWTRLWSFLLAAVFLAACPPGGVRAEEGSPFVENEWNFVEESMDVSKGIPETANGVLARIRETGVLRVATEPYFSPQEFIDPALEGQAQYVGADMNLARLIAERMGVQLVILPMEFTEVLRAVAEDQADLAISALSYTPGRSMTNELSKGYYFSDAPSNITMVIRAEDAEKYRKAEDLEDATLAAQRGSLQEAVTVEKIRLYREFRRLGQTQEVYNAVIGKQADAGVVDMENAINYLRSNPDCGLMLAEDFRFTLEEQFTGDRIAGKKGETELMYFVNGVIDEVVGSGKYNEWYVDAQKRADELGL